MILKQFYVKGVARINQRFSGKGTVILISSLILFVLLYSTQTGWTSGQLNPTPTFTPTNTYTPTPTCGALATPLTMIPNSFRGENYGDTMGYGVSGIGDINNDGYDDFAFGAYKNSEIANEAGQTYIFYGNSTGWSPNLSAANANASFRGENANDRSGLVVAGVGDVNGDNYADFVITAYQADDGGTADVGKAYLIFGGSGFQGTSLRDKNLSSLNMTTSVPKALMLKGEEANAQLRMAAGVGDVNGDGINDFALGALMQDVSGQTDCGKVYLILGRSTGWANLTSSVSAAAVATFKGEASSDTLGPVAGAGDVNGDYLSDFLISGPGNDDGGSDAGKVYLVFGTMDPESKWPSIVDLNTADADDNVASFKGQASGDNLGCSIAGAGDVDNDGFDDILMGARFNDEGGIADRGQGYLVRGERNATNWGVNINVGNMTHSGTPKGASFWGRSEGDQCGNWVEGIGDYNGDGYDDFAVGAWSNNDAYNNAGKTYIYYGKNCTTNPFFMDQQVCLADFALAGEPQEALSGGRIARVGGAKSPLAMGDFLVCAPFCNGYPNSDYKGKSYLLLSTGYPPTPTPTPSALTDNFESRAEGADNFSGTSSPSPGISWTVTNLLDSGSAPLITTRNNGNLCMKWPKTESLHQPGALAVANQTAGWKSQIVTFTYSHQYQADAALVLLKTNIGYYEYNLWFGRLRRVPTIGEPVDLVKSKFLELPWNNTSSADQIKVSVDYQSDGIRFRIWKWVDDEDLGFVGYREGINYLDVGAQSTFSNGGMTGFLFPNNDPNPNYGGHDKSFVHTITLQRISQTGTQQPTYTNTNTPTATYTPTITITPTSTTPPSWMPTFSDNFDGRADPNNLSMASEGNLTWQRISGVMAVATLTPTVVNNSRRLSVDKLGSVDGLVIAVPTNVPSGFTNFKSADVSFTFKGNNVNCCGFVFLKQNDSRYYYVSLAANGSDPNPLIYKNKVLRVDGINQTPIPDSGLPGDWTPPYNHESQLETKYRIGFDVIKDFGVHIMIDKDDDGTLEYDCIDTSSEARTVDQNLQGFPTGGSVGWLHDSETNVDGHRILIDNFRITGGTPPTVPTVSPTYSPIDGGYQITFNSPDGAKGYDIRYSTGILSGSNFYQATQVPNIPDPLPAGNTHTIKVYGIGGNPLYFGIQVIGERGLRSSGTYSSTSIEPLNGTAPWTRPASNKVGIDLAVSGQSGTDFVYEYLFYDNGASQAIGSKTGIDDHGVLYMKDTTELKLEHNCMNSLGYELWGGGTNSGPDRSNYFSLGSALGTIRYRFDTDGLWAGDNPKQAYVEGGYTYSVKRYKEHPMYKPYTAPFTPKSHYDSISGIGGSTFFTRIGKNQGSSTEQNYSKGYLDPNTGEEWHELAYWDDDLNWLDAFATNPCDAQWSTGTTIINNKANLMTQLGWGSCSSPSGTVDTRKGNIHQRSRMSSDGKTVWIILNPNAPVPSFSGASGTKYFTTRPKSYYSGQICQQTTYYTNGVYMTLSDLSPTMSGIWYSINNGSWTSYSTSVMLPTALPNNTPVSLKMRFGSTGPIRERKLIRIDTDADCPSRAETHPSILLTKDEINSESERIRADDMFDDLCTEEQEAEAIVNQDYHNSIGRIQYGPVAESALASAFVYLLDSSRLIDGQPARSVALDAWRALLATAGSLEFIGDENQDGQWNTPCGETVREWWDRDSQSVKIHLAYDLLMAYYQINPEQIYSGLFPDISPIDDLKLRESLAEEAYVKMKFASKIKGNWNTHASMGLLAASYSMEKYQSPLHGGAATPLPTGVPFTEPNLSWQGYVERTDFEEGKSTGPLFQSSIWKAAWPDGMMKESGSYDATARGIFSIFLNMYARKNGEAGLHDLLTIKKHPELIEAFKWSLKTRFPGTRWYQSYGQSRYSDPEDFQLLLNSHFEDYLDLGYLKWNIAGRNFREPNNRGELVYRLAWENMAIPTQIPSKDISSFAGTNTMVFQNDYTDPNAIQLVVFGRQEPPNGDGAHRKDDTTTMVLNAFGDRFLMNTDNAEDKIKDCIGVGHEKEYTNCESQNVIQVDRDPNGTITTLRNDELESGPKKWTLGTVLKSRINHEDIHYGVIETHQNPNDDSAYGATPEKNDTKLQRHILFSDKLFFVVYDQLDASDSSTHSYDWAVHCPGSFSSSTDLAQKATFLKTTGNKLDICFFSQLNDFPPPDRKKFTMPMFNNWDYSCNSLLTLNAIFFGERSGVNTHFLTVLIPYRSTDIAPSFRSIATSPHSSGRIIFSGQKYLVCAKSSSDASITETQDPQNSSAKLTTNARFAFAKYDNGNNLLYVFVTEDATIVKWGDSPVNIPLTDSRVITP